VLPSDQRAGTGGEGILVTSKESTIDNLAIEAPKGDAIKVTGLARARQLRGVSVAGPAGRPRKQWRYGLYRLLSETSYRDGVIREARTAGL